MKRREKQVTKVIGILVGIVVVGIVAWLIIASLMGPPCVERFEEIQPYETAFVVPLEGANKTVQGKFGSVEYLEAAKVATKRINIPLRKKTTGRWPSLGDFEWVPTVRVIRVNRTPVTREWTASMQTGSDTTKQDIDVESKDSISFGVGINITAFVTEKDASRFLYYYPGKSLAQVIDTNVRGAVAAILSREFGSRLLKDCKTDKRDITEIMLKEVKEDFSSRGVTVENVGIVGGLTYHNQRIQDAIDHAYEEEMKVEAKRQERLAQAEVNKKEVEMAEASARAAKAFAAAAEERIKQVRLEIEKMRAKAALIAAEKWNGNVPSQILPQGSQFLFGLDAPRMSAPTSQMQNDN